MKDLSIPSFVVSLEPFDSDRNVSALPFTVYTTSTSSTSALRVPVVKLTASFPERARRHSRIEDLPALFGPVRTVKPLPISPVGVANCSFPAVLKPR